jgi:iron complex outermembrane receptor protein
MRKTKIAAVLALQSAAIAAQAQQPVLEEVVVTSQYREQSLQEVPVAVTAFSTADIEDAGIGSTQGFIDLTPNVSLDDSFTYGNTFVSIRGVSQINNADSPVAIVVDGVPQNNQKQFKMKLFDIERIEVLKGPQGALYGRNAIGGAINIVSKKPTNEVEGFAKLSAGNGGLVDVSAGISAPIIDDVLSVRLAGSYLERDGLIDNVYLNQKADFVDEDYSLRGRMLFTPNDTFSADLRLSTSEFDAGSLYDVVTHSNLNPVYRSGGANSFFDPDSSFLGRTEGEVDEAALKLDIDLGFATLTAISAYTDLREDYRGDLDFSNAGALGGFQSVFGELRQAQNLDVDMFSQELRLVSNNSEGLRWIAGVFYIATDRQLETRAGCDDDLKCATFLEAAFGLPFTPPIDFEFINRNEDNDNTAWSVFSQFEMDLSEQLTAQFGLRYDRDEREQLDVNAGTTLDESFDAWQPKLTLNYTLADNKLAYATYSTGFRSGGFNAPGLGLSKFDDETLQNFELGFKSELLDRRLMLNAAVFYSLSDDYQFFFVDAASAAQFIGNIEEVSILGLDLDFRYVVNESLEVLGGIGITDSEIDKLGDVGVALAASGVDISRVEGSRVPKNTPFSANVAVQWEQPVSGDMTLRLRANWEHRGKKYWQADNLDVQDALNLFGLRAGLDADAWSITLWAENLSDEEYYTDYNPAEFSGSQVDIGFPAQPRSFGVDAELRF